MSWAAAGLLISTGFRGELISTHSSLGGSLRPDLGCPRAGQRMCSAGDRRGLWEARTEVFRGCGVGGEWNSEEWKSDGGRME